MAILGRIAMEVSVTILVQRKVKSHAIYIYSWYHRNLKKGRISGAVGMVDSIASFF